MEFFPELWPATSVETSVSLHELIGVCLFTDQRAHDDDLLPITTDNPQDRRGWWADPAKGSGLWHVRRQPLGSAARRESLAMIETALTGHGLASVQVSELAGAAGNVSSVVLQVTGQHNGRQFVVSVPL